MNWCETHKNINAQNVKRKSNRRTTSIIKCPQPAQLKNSRFISENRKSDGTIFGCDYIKLKKFCIIVLNIYAPLHFEIMKDDHISTSAKHYLRAIKLCRDVLSDPIFDIGELDAAFKSLKRNCFNAHPESISLGIADKDIDENTKIKIYEKIIQARKFENQQKLKENYKCRQYFPPFLKVFGKVIHDYLNLEADNISELIDYGKSGAEYFTESALLKKYSPDQLWGSVKGKLLPLPMIKVHSQSNEKCVQDTWRAKKNCKKENLHGKIIVTNTERELFPIDSSKDHIDQHLMSLKDN